MTWYEIVPAFVHGEPKIVFRESVPEETVFAEALEEWIADLEQWLEGERRRKQCIEFPQHRVP